MTASYRDLKVWRDAMSLAERVYAITVEFPPQERYGLVQQMRRAAVSIPSNITEGYGRKPPASDTASWRTPSAPCSNSRRRSSSPAVSAS